MSLRLQRRELQKKIKINNNNVHSENFDISGWSKMEVKIIDTEKKSMHTFLVFETGCPKYFEIS